MDIQFLPGTGPSMPINAPFFMHGMKIEPLTVAPELPEFGFTVGSIHEPMAPITGHHACGRQCVSLSVLASLQPLEAKRAKRTPGKADPIWDGEFRCKITKKPLPTTLVNPKGFTGPVGEIIERHLAREDELIELIRTQHMEISPLAQQLAANGIAVTRFNLDDEDDEHEGGNFEYASDKNGVPYSPDPLTLAATARRIEWERNKLNCGITSRCRWTVTEDNTVGIEYLGDRWNEVDKTTKKQEYALAQKRKFKYDWIEAHGSMPTVDEIKQARAFNAYYGNPARFLMSDEEYEQWLAFRKYGEPEISMDDLGAEDLDPDCNIEQEHATCTLVSCSCRKCHRNHVSGGPEELGLHSLVSYVDSETGKRITRATFEPGENSSMWNEDSTESWEMIA